MPPSSLQRCAALTWIGALLLASSGCRPGHNAAATAAPAPSMAATGQARCGVRSSSSKPLIVEWPAAERAALEGRASKGIVPVRFTGCEMEVLTTCRVTGEYTYTGITAKTEAVRITSADELYASMPVGAAKLEAKLETHGQLSVDMTIIGRKEADRFRFGANDLEGRCENATHVITGLTVGAFTFSAGSGAEVGAGASVGNAGAGAASSASREVLNTDGNVDACSVATGQDFEPPTGCGALLRVEVVPVDAPQGPIAAGPSAPPGTAASPTRVSAPADAPTIEATPEEMAALDRKIKTLSYVSLSSYLASVGLMSVAIYAGIGMREDATDALYEANDDPNADRQALISDRRTADAVTYGTSIGAGVLFIGALWISLRTTKLKVRRARMTTAGVFPIPGGGAVGAVGGRF